MGITHLADDICDIASDQESAWRDALDDKNLDDTLSISKTATTNDILVNSFKEAEKKYGLSYTAFVGDGDISVCPSLITGHLIAKAPQLIGNSFSTGMHHSHTLHYTFTNFSFKGSFTTSLAESWMHVHCKFDGGKRVNRSQGRAWEGRCAGGGLLQNLDTLGAKGLTSNHLEGSKLSVQG